MTIAALALALAACGGDDTSGADQAEEGLDVGEVAEQAEDTLEDAGVDTQREGSATATLDGTPYEFTAVESFGCFLSADGGSQGAIDFEGTDEAGNELLVSWAGDSPDSSTARITLDGTDLRSAFGAEVAATAGDDEASFATTVLTPDGSESELSVEIAC